jgi:hypothetical protein
LGKDDRFLLCEFASVNPDGTHTIVRGGFEHWAALVPFQSLFFGLIEIGRDVLPAVGNRAQIHLRAPSGLEAQVGELILTPEAGKLAYFAFAMSPKFDDYGLWRFQVRVAKLTLTATLDVRTPKP